MLFDAVHPQNLPSTMGFHQDGTEQQDLELVTSQMNIRFEYYGSPP